MPKIELPFSHTYAALDNAFYSAQTPSSVPEPEAFARNLTLARSLGIDEAWFQSDDATQVFAGNSIPTNAKPIATAYAGHQFGHFNPQLGDGRAILLGEIATADGQRVDIQLKGAGQTHYSRGGDGRSPLGPVIREYIMSEAMAALGVPTSRSLFAVTTGEAVYRQMPEPGGVLCRVASSHIRVGTFQFFAARGQTEHVKTLADYVIKRHYPDCSNAANPYQALYEAICTAQAQLIAHWHSLGFVHGVMNTDNMLVCGETIDYGPCAFIDTYQSNALFSSIDQSGRYALDQQANILVWNLARLAECLIPLLHDDQESAINFAQECLQAAASHYEVRYQTHMAAKLGLQHSTRSQKMVKAFLLLLEQHKLDYTLTLRALSEWADGDQATKPTLFNNAFDEWLAAWQNTRIKNNQLSLINPVYIPRLHLIEAAIQQAYTEHSFSLFEQLLAACTAPYKRQQQWQQLAQSPTMEEKVSQTFCGT